MRSLAKPRWRKPNTADPAYRRFRHAGAPGEQGFTFAEMLAALFFVALVIPIALQGIAVANRSATLADHQWTAARLADRLLNELVVTEQWQNGTNQGTLEPEWPGYHWTLQQESWPEGDMTQLTLYVFFTVQQMEHSVSITTLVDDSQSTFESTTTTTQS